MKRRVAVLALAIAGPALAQAPCPLLGEITPEMLLGLWQAELPGQWDTSTLQLVKHPEYAGSFRGTLQRGDRSWQVAGEFTDGEFLLEESADGRRIAAAWAGEIVEGSCGREIRGTWTRDGESQGGPFVLRRM
ncbi:hypothetical protein H8N03_14190 [Ramlibacter sp. USB13]|uniref:DUF1579 domain-containing protein n=1 Tax=Ramlibacter cellulosilyticus TaxID=2764187 RepID=A0A923MSS1_9BURK|nr:hypothetical protein [Ramlibacter cellulosilyticus]MBC5784098.1 hypothetical protein [Ramlibacter cellulosilyticus]